jgi:DNA-directed RNA polymerase specialized sigma24 family protein
LESLYSRRYSAADALALAILYYSDPEPEVLNELIRAVAPLVGMVSLKEIGKTIHYNDLDTLRAGALVKAYELLSAQAVPLNSEGAFSAFLYRAARYAMIDVLRDSPHQTFEYEIAAIREQTTVPGPELAVEPGLWYNQVRELILNAFKEDCRFVGKEREACLLVARALLDYTDHNPLSIQFRYRLTKQKTKKLIQYTQIALRMAFYYVLEIDAS